MRHMCIENTGACSVIASMSPLLCITVSRAGEVPTPACATHVASHEGTPVGHGWHRGLICVTIRLHGRNGLPGARGALDPVLAQGSAPQHRTSGSAASCLLHRCRPAQPVVVEDDNERRNKGADICVY